jgi:hypothetical protein
MKRDITIIAVAAALGLALAAIPAIAQPAVQSNTEACLFPIGGWTIVNCSAAAAAQSGALNVNSKYIVQCGDDSYIATGDQATDEADSSDGYLPEGAWLELRTSRSVRYISCLNVNVDSDCRYIECQ